MQIEPYCGQYDNQIRALILGIQNNEANIDLSLEEQPDLLDIHRYHQKNGGEFWIALSDGAVIGTIGLMLRENHCAVMKKFFVDQRFRSRKIGLTLYNKLLAHAAAAGVRHIILDTPGCAHRSHQFYETAGFYKINPIDLPVPYAYPDRNSVLYRLDL